MNAGFIEPLGARELAGIVKSVVRYQRANLESGKQQEMFSRIQAARDRKSGVKRRAKTADRDAASIQAVQAGQSMRSVAREYGLGLTTCAMSYTGVRYEPKQDDAPAQALWGHAGDAYNRHRSRGGVNMTERELTEAEWELIRVWSNYSAGIEGFRTAQQEMMKQGIGDLTRKEWNSAKGQLRQVLRDVDNGKSETQFPPDLIDKVRKVCKPN